MGKSAIAGAIGGAIASKANKNKKKPKVEVNDDDEEIIASFAHELHQLHSIQFSDNTEDLTNKLDEIYYGTKGYKWKYASDGINKITVTENNRSLSKCLNKFEHGLELLKKSTDSEELIKQYNKKFKKLKLKKILNKFGLFIGLVFLFFILVLIIWISE